MTPEQQLRAALARHLTVLASANNVQDWPAYIREVANAHLAGDAWLDHSFIACTSRRGHKWRQKIWGVLGYDVCSRRRCTAERENPRARMPWDD